MKVNGPKGLTKDIVFWFSVWVIKGLEMNALIIFTHPKANVALNKNKDKF